METRKVDGADVFLTLRRDSAYGPIWGLYPSNFKQLSDVANFSFRPLSIRARRKPVAPPPRCRQRTRLRNGGPLLLVELPGKIGAQA